MQSKFKVQVYNDLKIESNIKSKSKSVMFIYLFF